MNEYDRHLLRKKFTKTMGKLFFYGFTFTLLITLLFGGPKNVYYVDEFGRPMDQQGRLLDRNGRPISSKNSGYSNYDPYGLSGRISAL